jgi:hypothetical protein
MRARKDEGESRGSREADALATPHHLGAAPGKLTRSEHAAPATGRAAPLLASPSARLAAPRERMEDWDPASLAGAMGYEPAEPDGWDAAQAHGAAPALLARAGRSTAAGAQPLAQAPARSAPRAAGPVSSPARDQEADPAEAERDALIDLSGQVPRRGPQPNAHMMVRALSSADGELLDLWTGAAYFVGELPVSYQARRTAGKAWTWTRNGDPDPSAAQLKIDSDAHGRSGETVAQWAPPAATSLTVDFVPLTQPFGQPFGADGARQPGAPSPSGAPAPFSAREADGSLPLAADPAAALEGPQARGTFREHGALTLFDEANGSTIRIGKSYVRLYGKPEAFLYRVAPQTSPRQRLLQITATSDVKIDAHADPSEAVELVQQLRIAPASEIAAQRGANEADTLVLRVPEISASGDSWRVVLRMGKSAIHITALSADARFAYYVDPDWSGTARAVHVVATPGVRIEEAPTEGTPYGIDDPRTLVVNRIYVQDPSLVPQQGEPIEPSRYLGIVRHDNAPLGLSPSPESKAAFTVATGGSGVTVRDLESGASLTIRAEDPTLGARYLHRVEGQQVLALVGKHARVDVALRRPEPNGPSAQEEAGLSLDFGQVDFLIYEADRDDRFPPPGAVLTRELLEQYGHRREPDSMQWAPKVEKSDDQRGLELLADLALACTPGVGDVLDLADASFALAYGTDKWGNPLSKGEKIAIFIAALLPILTVGVVLGASRMAKVLRVARAARAISLAQRLGRSESEVQALLAGLRRLDGEARAAARRVEQAVSLGGHVDPADLKNLEKSLTQAGFRGIDFPDVGAGAPRLTSIENTATTAEHAAEPGAKAAPLATASRTALLVEKERELGQALEQHARALGARRAARRARVEVIPKREFVARFGSDKARAVFQRTDRGPVIFARADATASDMLDEAAHLAQLADPAITPSIRALDEANLEAWASLSVSDRLELYQHKLDVEIDAKRRTHEAIRKPGDRLQAEEALHDLEQRQAQVAAIEPDELARMNAGQLAAPAYLDQAPRLFGKRRVAEELPTLHARGESADLAPRPVSKTQGSADYSAAYSQGDVVSVHQLGHSWTETTQIAADLDGTVLSRTVSESGATRIVIEQGKRRKTHFLEAGSEVDARITPGRKVAAGQRLGQDPPREYRKVQVRTADGRTVERSEIRSWAEGRSWVQRGSESTERGRLAEAAARTEADADLAVRLEKQEISGAVRIPHSVGGGGFDDVLVEFTGEGQAMTARVRIREVKDHANRHVALEDFSALLDNFNQNYEGLLTFVDNSIEQTRRGQQGTMTSTQLFAVQRSLRRQDYTIEIVLGSSTRIGSESHHSSRVLPMLRRQHSQLKVSRIKGE